MPLKEKYGWFIKGRNLVILYWDGYQWVSPPTDIGDETDNDWSSDPKGFMLEYSAVPDLSGIINEDSKIPAPDILSLALVDYINAKVKEEQGDLKMKEYYMQEFKKKVFQLDAKKTGGLRRVSPRPLGSIT
tara:strand:+ start:14748 stop:15140 length:393 start_codon:yes stop_codon:yes gene_type:complete